MENLVIRIAKIIRPDAWAVFYSSTDADATPSEPTTRMKYLRAEAESKAVEVLKALHGLKGSDVSDALYEHEIEGWKRLGVPVEVDDLKEIIRRKHYTCDADRPS